MTGIMFFGGPWNEQVMAVDLRCNQVEIPMPERVAYTDEPVVAVAAGYFRRVRYDIEKVGVSIDGEALTWRVGVAQGFPRHRITDQMNAILAMCRWPWSLGREVES